VRSYWSLLLLLASMWGASYLFIKVAVEDIPPAAMTDLRLSMAAVLLFVYLAYREGAMQAVGQLRAAWLPCLVLGIINAAIPMTLVAWGETHIDSSIAGIAQSSVPIFVAILGLRFLPHDPLGRLQTVGLVIGITGVALITGVHPDGGTWAVAGTFAVVLSSVSYASGGIYGQLHVHGTPGPVLATGSMIAGALALLPFAMADSPTALPGATALSALLALVLIPTFLGQLLLFRILRLFGSRRLSLVTFLMPGFAVVYGAVLLDEHVSGAALAGLTLILVGVVLASGQRLFGVRVQEERA
jgi:drug/metabolite transporter (DMT)-like permease